MATFFAASNQLSILCLGSIIQGYQAGAFTQLNILNRWLIPSSVIAWIHGGQVLLNQEVTNFRLTDKTVTGVEAIDLTTHQTHLNLQATLSDLQYLAPKESPKWFELKKEFISSKPSCRKLNYEYSASNYMVCCVVKGASCRDYDFVSGMSSIPESGSRKWNLCSDVWTQSLF
jgi:hypothetical protein